MKLFVCADIFGVTPELTAAVAALPVPGVITGPASAIGMKFSDDQQAYAAFVAAGGLPAYTAAVRQMLLTQQPTHLLGFSAGAAVLWQLIAQAEKARTVQQALLCYGGQIRQFDALQPLCPVHCLWSDESHFDVIALQQQLAASPGNHTLSQQHWPYPHGFINPHSKNYQAAAASQFWQQVHGWLNSTKPPAL